MDSDEYAGDCIGLGGYGGIGGGVCAFEGVVRCCHGGRVLEGWKSQLLDGSSDVYIKSSNSSGVIAMRATLGLPR
jgi:hypothetical protein